MFKLHAPPLPKRGSASGYALGLGATAIGLAARIPLEALAGGSLPPFVTVFPVVVFASLAGGAAVGLASTVSSFFIIWFFWIEPAGAFSVEDRQAAVMLGTFAASGLLTAVIAGGVRALYDEARAHETERVLFARETVHRIKNLIAVVQALNRHTAAQAADAREHRDQMESALFALGAAQSVLLNRDWKDIEIAELVNSTLSPFSRSQRLVIAPGPKVVLPSKSASGIALALYELATNATKYGALRTDAADQDAVRLTWDMKDGWCQLRWREVSAPTAARQAGSGLGSILINSAISPQDGGAVRYERNEGGVDCTFEWRAREKVG